MATVTTHRLSDGSVCEVDSDGRHAIITRLVDGRPVWAQSFASAIEHADTLARVVSDMDADPAAYDRGLLWDVQTGAAVRP